MKDWLKSQNKPRVEKDTAGSDLTRKELLEVLNMPKIEIEIFEGDPLKYNSFINVFKEQVDRRTSDPWVASPAGNVTRLENTLYISIFTEFMHQCLIA